MFSVFEREMFAVSLDVFRFVIYIYIYILVFLFCLTVFIVLDVFLNSNSYVVHIVRLHVLFALFFFFRAVRRLIPHLFLMLSSCRGKLSV